MRRRSHMSVGLKSRKKLQSPPGESSEREGGAWNRYGKGRMIIKNSGLKTEETLLKKNGA